MREGGAAIAEGKQFNHREHREGRREGTINGFLLIVLCGLGDLCG
jgi:hypothetical protein